MLLRKGDHVLFYGDSITDAGRLSDQPPLGSGYVAICASLLAETHPELDLRFTNTGISGNRVYDLEARLDVDLLAHRPTVVSIMIGINDTWRRYDSQLASPIPDFEACLRRILERVRDELAARVVICEPFLLPTLPDRAAWREDLDPRIGAVRALAREFADTLVPLDGLFAAAACQEPMAAWLPDGVHPTSAGHALIADAWIRAVTETG